MTTRHRCLITGCNPYLVDQQAAQEHKEATGHRVAKWPVRSAAGKRKARDRSRNGYYDKYNSGRKSAEVRGYDKYNPSDPWGSYSEHSLTGFESMYEDGWYENS